LTKEELFGTNGMYEVYQARAKGTNEGFTDIESKIVDIQMEDWNDCMLETNYFNYLYDLPIKESLRGRGRAPSKCKTTLQ
ncbi:hypothetical protein, partial [Candidatus Pseudothioglobus singularis]|uniref:hypothetical protein n=1 Tax=Candidatus Pseudothioglobus singularis TaxID=1427364 RepID=UPI0018D37F96